MVGGVPFDRLSGSGVDPRILALTQTATQTPKGFKGDNRSG